MKLYIYITLVTIDFEPSEKDSLLCVSGRRQIAESHKFLVFLSPCAFVCVYMVG